MCAYIKSYLTSLFSLLIRLLYMALTKMCTRLYPLLKDAPDLHKWKWSTRHLIFRKGNETWAQSKQRPIMSHVQRQYQCPRKIFSPCFNLIVHCSPFLGPTFLIFPKPICTSNMQLQQQVWWIWIHWNTSTTF